MKALSFYADGEGYAVDIRLVQKMARRLPVTPVAASPACVTGIANIKGKAVTILDVTALQGGERERRRAVDAVIFKPFRDESDRMGLAMDKPGDLIETGELTGPRSAYIRGVAERAGQLYRVIDVEAIINRFREEE